MGGEQLEGRGTEGGAPNAAPGAIVGRALGAVGRKPEELAAPGGQRRQRRAAAVFALQQRRQRRRARARLARPRRRHACAHSITYQFLLNHFTSVEALGIEVLRMEFWEDFERSLFLECCFSQDPFNLRPVARTCLNVLPRLRSVKDAYVDR